MRATSAVAVRALAGSALAALALVQCGERAERTLSPQATPLGVEAFFPAGEIGTRSTVSVVFDRAVVRLGDRDPDFAAGREWLVLDPTVAGSYHWVGTRTLTFTGALPSATEFRARVPAGARAIDGAQLQRDVEWRFTTPRPQLVASLPAAGDSLARPGDPIVLRFNLGVDPGPVD